MIIARILAALLASLPVISASGDSLVTFPNGVAAGDVAADSAVLWSRSSIAGDITFEVASDEAFASIVSTATAEVSDPTVPAKVEVTGLEAGTRYHYRATHSSGDVATGRFRTPHLAGTFTGLRFGVSGDWRGELSPYPSVSNAPDRDLEFFVGLGDTIYADYASPAVPKEQAETIEEFRAKHDEVYSGRHNLNALGDLRASTVFIPMIDDHEIANDFAGGAPAGSDERFGGGDVLINESPLFLTGILAFEEYNPIQALRYDTPEDPRTHGKAKLYRTRRYGDDAAIFLLDARGFRDEELDGVPNPLDGAALETFNSLSFDRDPATGDPLPRRTMLGAAQLADLKADLLSAHQSGARWKFVMVPEPIQNLGAGAAQDRFEGYATERTELLSFIAEQEISNVVFIAADIHGTVVNNLFYQEDLDEPHIPINSFEVVTGSVAYDKPFGPTTFDEAEKITIPLFGNLLSFALSNVGVGSREAFDSLPLAEKDSKYHQIMDSLLQLQGFDKIGLDESGIDAELLHGGYVAAHSFGWTEFEIDAVDQSLTVTTYGIEAYTIDEIGPELLDRTPEIVSQFRVTPASLPMPPPMIAATVNGDTITVTWPEAAGSYVLQSSAALGGSADWQVVSGETTIVDGIVSASVLIDGSTSFFRLIRSE